MNSHRGHRAAPPGRRGGEGLARGVEADIAMRSLLPARPVRDPLLVLLVLPLLPPTILLRRAGPPRRGRRRGGKGVLPRRRQRQVVAGWRGGVLLLLGAQKARPLGVCPLPVVVLLPLAGLGQVLVPANPVVTCARTVSLFPRDFNAPTLLIGDF